MQQASKTPHALPQTPNLKRGAPGALSVFVGAFLWVFVQACSPAESLPTAFFAAPSGMALAGSDFDHLFVANTGKDAVQVVQLTAQVRQVDTKMSPARFFPLNIPVGASPSELAATADGRFVFALDSINSQVQLIDAEGLARVRDAQGRVLVLSLGDSGSEPAAILGSQYACVPSEAQATSTCLGRAYVVMRATGQVAVIDVRQSSIDQSLFLMTDRLLEVGGAPMRIAADPQEQALFLTDVAAAELIRMPLTKSAPQAERFALGAIGGPVTVSADGTFVIVGRPAQQDVVVFMSDAGPVAQGNLAVQAADAVWTPLPQCVQECASSVPNACDGALEADQALCVVDGNLAANVNGPYAGIYLAGAPAQLAALGADKAGRFVVASCESDVMGRQQAPYSQSVAIAQLDGTLRLLGLRNTAGEVALELLDAGFCMQPQLSRFPNSRQPLADVLAPCGQAVPNQRRFACAGEPDGPGVLTVLRGQANKQAWGLIWEGVVVGGAASFSGATIDADGDISLPTALLAGANIVAQTGQGGDIVEVLTTPTVHEPGCYQALSQGSLRCQLERRITNISPQADASMTTVRLNSPLPRACFSHGLSIRILAGDAFVVVPVDKTGMAQNAVARVNLGAAFGPGLVPYVSPSFSFAVRSDLDPATDAPACSRYDRGAPGPHPSVGLNRGQLLSFRVGDPFLPQPVAERLDSLGRPLGPMGAMPKSMVATRTAARQAQNPNVVDFLCVSFGGSDGVLVLDPYDTPSPENRDTTSRMLQ